MKKIIILIGLTMSLNAFSKDCISQSELNQISKHFSQFKNLANADYCDDDSQTWHLLKTIMFMRETTFNNQMKNSSDELFSGRFASDWYQYFIGRIDDISVQTSCPKGVGAYVYGFGGKTMYVCPMMLTNNFSALDRASVFMHEARHIDGYPHSTCSQGARKGIQGACDDAISDGGSYAVTVETYAQLAKYAHGIHPALKAYSMASAVTYADEAFETPVKVHRKTELLVMNNNKNLFALDSQTLSLKELGQAPFIGKIIPRAQHLILFPEDKNQNARYLFSKNEGEISQSPGELVSIYNSLPPAEKANLLDVHIGGQWSAKIYSQKITFSCDPKSSATSDLTLGQETAQNLIYPQGYNRTAKGTYLMATSGNVLEIGCSDRTMKPFIRASTYKMDRPYVQVHRLEPYIVALDKNGELYLINNQSSTPLKTSQNGQIVQLAPRQSFEFMDAP